jgi:catechol 2,3-dioxygenase-like lactoylglutathione lyase family enzyme
MIDHIGLRVDDVSAAAEFYDAVFAVFRYGRTYADPDLVGYGSPDHSFLWLHRSETAQSATHVAFAASNRSAVDAFHSAGLSAGGRDNGAPGLRVAYGPSYYAAFLIDPSGNNVEVVCIEEDR